MDFLDLEAADHGFPWSGGVRSWITLIWKSQIMDFLDQEVPVDLEAPDHGFPWSGGPRSWISLIWRSQIMDFLDLEVPDHGSPRSRDRKLRIAMKTLQIKGSGLAGRPLDPVKRIGNPSNKSRNPSNGFRCQTDGTRAAQIRLKMSNGLPNLSNGDPSNKKIKRILVKRIPSNRILDPFYRLQNPSNKIAVKRIRQTDSWIRQTNPFDIPIRQTKNQTDWLSNGSVKQIYNPSNKIACQTESVWQNVKRIRLIGHPSNRF